ncbi:MAG: hypothetical protein WCB49_04260, partial [Gammaproteobacteria bacterium]
MSGVPLVIGVPAFCLLAAFVINAWNTARRYTLVRLAAALFCLLGFGATAHAATLWQVWQAARTHDPAFQAAAAALSKARAAR